MSEIDAEDLQHLAALFHIHEKATGHPKLKALADEAMRNLEAYAKTLEPEPALQPQHEPADPGVEIGASDESAGPVDDGAEHADVGATRR